MHFHASQVHNMSELRDCVLMRTFCCACVRVQCVILMTFRLCRCYCAHLQACDVASIVPCILYRVCMHSSSTVVMVFILVFMLSLRLQASEFIVCLHLFQILDYCDWRRVEMSQACPALKSSQQVAKPAVATATPHVLRGAGHYRLQV